MIVHNILDVILAHLYKDIVKKPVKREWWLYRVWEKEIKLFRSSFKKVYRYVSLICRPRKKYWMMSMIMRGNIGKLSKLGEIAHW